MTDRPNTKAVDKVTLEILANHCRAATESMAHDDVQQALPTPPGLGRRAWPMSPLA